MSDFAQPVRSRGLKTEEKKEDQQRGTALNPRGDRRGALMILRDKASPREGGCCQDGQHKQQTHATVH